MTTDRAGRTLGNHVRRRSFLRSGAGALLGGLLAGCLTDPTVSPPSGTGAGTVSRARSDTTGTAVRTALSRPPSLGWVRRYESNPGGSGTPSPGPDVEVVAATTAPDGGYALAGHVDTPGETRRWILLRTDPEGHERWRRRFGGGTQPVRARTVLRTADGGFLVAGQLPFPFPDERQTPVETDPGRGSRPGAAARTDSRGRIEWRAYPEPDTGGMLWDAARVSERRFALVGWVEQADGYAGWFVTLDGSGEAVTDETFDSPNDDADRVTDYTVADVFTTVAVSADGGLVVAGKNAAGGQVRKLDPDGGTLWTTQFDFPRDVAYDAVPTADGGAVVTGRLFDDGSRSPPMETGHVFPTSLYLTRLDASGEERWTRAYGAGRNEYGHTVEPTPDGGCLVAGGSVAGANGRNQDVFLVKTDPEGRAAWRRRYLGSERGAAGRDLVRAADGDYALAAGDVFVKFETDAGATGDETPVPTPTTTGERSSSP